MLLLLLRTRRNIRILYYRILKRLEPYVSYKNTEIITEIN